MILGRLVSLLAPSWRCVITSRLSKLYLVGDSDKIESELGKHQCNDSRIDIVHSTQVVDMSDRAWTAVRHKKDSSVSRAVDLVKRGQADAIVTAGHTGAAVAASMVKLRTLPGIDRPGIAAVLPTQTNVFVLIDAGANIDARPEHLLQYAFMGSVYSRHVLGYKSPTVGLVSLGEEDVKGTEKTKEVFKMLKSEFTQLRRQHRGPASVRGPCRSGRMRRICRQRDLENLRIDCGGDF